MQDYNRISVKFLVEQLLRHGDIKTGSGIVVPERAREGTLIHTRIQKKKKEENPLYQSEKVISLTIENEDPLLELYIEGRIDGYYIKDGTVYIEEYKTVSVPPEEYEEIHMAQALIYGAFIIIKNESLTGLSATVEYHPLKGKEYTDYTVKMSRDEAISYFTNLKDRYISFLKYRKDHFDIIKKELATLSFPYGSFREGQRDLAGAVYKTINEDGFSKDRITVCEAPTGIGKTAATIFPAVLSLPALGP